MKESGILFLTEGAVRRIVVSAAQIQLVEMCRKIRKVAGLAGSVPTYRIVKITCHQHRARSDQALVMTNGAERFANGGIADGLRAMIERPNSQEAEFRLSGDSHRKIVLESSIN